MKIIDHSVSGEEFTLVYDPDYDMYITQPQPEAQHLDRYYESEEYISHTDAKNTLFEKVYGYVKKRMLHKKLRLISKFNTSSKSLLDIGAGTGDFLKIARQHNWEIRGIEPNERARHLAQTKQVFLHTDYSTFGDQSFDVITMWHVLEHVPSISDQFEKFQQYGKPGGCVIIAVPNYKAYDARVYKNFWAAYDVPRHFWHFSKATIQKLARDHNMEFVTYKPLWFDSYYISMLSEKYKNGRIRMLSAFWNGTLSNIKGMINGEYSSQIYILRIKE